MINRKKILEFLKQRPDGSLFHRESKDLEFKEQFNLAGLAEYFRDFAAFANNAGGFLVFGVTNSPRKLSGLNKKSIESFEKIDPEKISGYLLDIFSPNIDWEQDLIEIEGKKFGIFYINEAKIKPIIAQKNEGKDQLIKNGDIFFRYAGRTQKIQHAELQNIIQKRVDTQNKYWSNLISKISKIGPANAAILDTEKGLIEKNDKQVLVIDEELIKKIKFLKEGSFSEKEGAIALKLIGDVNPINAIEITKFKKKNLFDLYPLSCRELIAAVKKRISSAKLNNIHDVIKENKLKEDADYSTYNFRNKSHEEEYEKSKKVAGGTPSIYNNGAVDFIVNVLTKK